MYNPYMLPSNEMFFIEENFKRNSLKELLLKFKEQFLNSTTDLKLIEWYYLELL